MDGRPMAEAPRDGTVILVETMNYAGVPATGGHKFMRVAPSKLGDCWNPVGEPNMHYGTETLLRWWPADTDPATLTLTPRTNWNFIPNNGTAGEEFYESWCEQCIRERPIREDYDYAIANGLGCDIYCRTMAFGIGDPNYPTEWTYAPNGVPKCTAFELDVGHPTQEPRCPLTLEMFQFEPVPPTESKP